jgi:hypothetical protein
VPPLLLSIHNRLFLFEIRSYAIIYLREPDFKKRKIESNTLNEKSPKGRHRNPWGKDVWKARKLL